MTEISETEEKQAIKESVLPESDVQLENIPSKEESDENVGMKAKRIRKTNRMKNRKTRNWMKIFR